MDYELDSGRGTARIQMDEGESITARRGVLAAKKPSITVETGTSGGITSAVKRQALGGDHGLTNTFQADSEGWLLLSPALPGELQSLNLHEESIYVVSESFIAAGEGLSVGADIQEKDKKKLVFGDDMFTVLEVSGTGTAIIGGYGGLLRDTIDDTEEIALGHIAAYDPSLDVEMFSPGGLKTSLLGGEDRFARLSGDGEVWIQSRSPESLQNWVESVYEDDGLSDLLG
ncbi:TIGR00266 family protein [Halorubrum gandharaense]